MAERRRRQAQANDAADLLQRGIIIGRYQANQSISQITREMGISRNTVKKWIKRHEEEGDVSTRSRSGRPRTTTRAQDASLVAAATAAPFKTSATLTRYNFM